MLVEENNKVYRVDKWDNPRAWGVDPNPDPDFENMNRANAAKILFRGVDVYEELPPQRRKPLWVRLFPILGHFA